MLAFTLAIEFITFVGMALPTFTPTNELLLVCPAALLVGLAVSRNERGLTLWVAPVLSCSVLILLRGSLDIVGVANGTLGSGDVLANLLSTVALVGGSGLSRWLPGWVLQRLRRRADQPTVD